jgi:phage gpG-like protein
MRRTIDINIDCDNDDAMRRLMNMKLRAKNFRPIFEYGRSRLQLANAENFSTGGLPSGGWEPRRQPEPWPLMRRTGSLMRSLTNLFGPPNDIDATSARFGTKVEYAKFHQYGTTKMPARKIIFEPRGFANDLASKAAAYVANGATP